LVTLRNRHKETQIPQFLDQKKQGLRPCHSVYIAALFFALHLRRVFSFAQQPVQTICRQPLHFRRNMAIQVKCRALLPPEYQVVVLIPESVRDIKQLDG